MAQNVQTGEVLDPFNGKLDLVNGMIKAVGNPFDRFLEDRLRILRMYRFSNRFGFFLDPQTDYAARMEYELNGNSLNPVSIERIHSELAKMLEDCSSLAKFVRFAFKTPILMDQLDNPRLTAKLGLKF